MSGDERMQADCRVPTRFTVSQRLEHMVLALSFTMLSVTGLVQKYPMRPVSDYLMTLMGGIQSTRVLHRVAAVVFVLLGVYHAQAVGYKYFVRRVAMTMMPTIRDLLDGFRWIRYSLFLRKDPPRMPRYNFAEKLEYWALIWGGIIMVITGFMLWNPLMTTLFLPGQVIPAAKAAHGGEAVLAVLAIIVWHFYHVHVKVFNKSMFTGKLTRHQMEEEHGEEWSEINNGAAPLIQEPGSLRRRQMLFMPVAAVAAALGIWGIYWAATAEATAVSSVPMQVYKTPIYSPVIPPAPESSRRADLAARAFPRRSRDTKNAMRVTARQA